MNEKTNTLRALKEETLLVTSWFCRFGWHQWAKWQDTPNGSDYIYQKRYCAHCNLVEQRRSD